MPLHIAKPFLHLPDLSFISHFVLSFLSLATILILLVIFQTFHIIKTSARELAGIDTFFTSRLRNISKVRFLSDGSVTLVGDITNQLNTIYHHLF